MIITNEWYQPLDFDALDPYDQKKAWMAIKLLYDYALTVIPEDVLASFGIIKPIAYGDTSDEEPSVE